ncbi:phosphoserine phosphatase SerB [Telmatospirillum siberiense]|uniref:Phosphoserine phosphatase n=1 Tax=Telmatospirillum siberiense TaxID=382514 RepID=A0A2N3PW43_9PROT|nr:phosphoserine phosphatase SerB [Telmatospirillum siberiense]PKU24619.1 phosphoserine phosphatase SerB [Telmatospirillum siberiense]
MDHVLTLIDADGGLDDAATTRIRSTLTDLGADTLSARWLAEGRAVDLPFTLLAPDQAEAAARRLLAGRPVDVIAQPAEHRRKMLLLADMDSTMVVGETLDELADFAGLKAEISAITARAMNGEIDFAGAFRERVGRLAGLSAACLEETFQRLDMMPGGPTLVATMKTAGAYTVLVSGGFRFFTGRVRERCGFDRDIGNDIEIADARLTGRVIEPIIDRGGKLQNLTAIAGERRLPLSLSLAVGDGANDLEMIDAAGLGVAFHAKPVVAAQARARVDYNDLTALLFAQGYREDEFVG